MWAVPLQVFIMYGALVPNASVNAYGCGCELKCCNQNNRMECTVVEEGSQGSKVKDQQSDAWRQEGDCNQPRGKSKIN